jgi:hypothetical protein
VSGNPAAQRPEIRLEETGEYEDADSATIEISVLPGVRATNSHSVRK